MNFDNSTRGRNHLPGAVDHGMLIDQDNSANFVPVNDADNWLHFGLGVGTVAVRFLIPRLAQRESPTDSPIR